jgi:hypothetical protein
VALRDLDYSDACLAFLIAAAGRRCEGHHGASVISDSHAGMPTARVLENQTRIQWN